MLGLIGPNGAGKTTLFECLAACCRSTRDRPRATGEPLTPRERASRLFYLPDGIAPWPAQTVRWALDFTLGFFGGQRERRRDEVDRAARSRAASRRARSARCRKGSASARCSRSACSRRSRCCWPTSRSTASTCARAARSAQTLRAHAAAGRTLFLSIHQISDAARVCDRFVLLSGGRVCGEGTLDELAALAAARGVRRPAGDLEEVFLALT